MGLIKIGLEILKEVVIEGLKWLLSKKEIEKDSEEIMKKGPIDTEKATLQEQENLRKLLENIKSKAIKDAQNLESQLINIYTQTADNFKDYIESNQKLQRSKDLAKYQIKDSITREIIEQIRLENTQFAKILKIQDDTLRREKISDFITNTLIKAIKQSENILQTNIQSLIADIKENLHYDIKMQENNLNSKMQFLNSILTSNDTQKQQAQATLGQKIFIESNVILNLDSIKS
ncbi:hypothetical protein DCO58_02825 [Helicobacter saguini]|uniref:Uncharacterized protein n=1 Tax=Helicobacter saguini TaxID=1548018 RepID=A0A347VS17_9HELI|nr:hypothetical protein [Helicobacter saguini]MWV62688.1 hypothetical protein [Helicobacter saguini]MWV66640.1 hypothetical protein [Helicobacter saguini]MWV68990.1 hypothetical protein [Helicobacter saguini]MWV71456.1 hypothetical protein [Helicobacter saguini]TLD94104.1 hypothetical protein LS64_007275 [Helicobacter saguini]